MKKKVLIYFPERKLVPKGGPAGYLYNLKSGLESFQHDDVEVYFYTSMQKKIEENNTLRNRIPKRVKEIRRAYKFANYLKKSLPIDKSMYGFDAIHFHSTEDMYLNRNFLTSYKGIVILTSHTPCVPYQELIGRLNPNDYKIFKKQIDNLVQMDKYAFERADYIIFPCEEAEEPYYHTWNDYGMIRNSEKYRFMPTGINKCVGKISRSDYRREHNIPQDAFVISYVGRHNEIKGFKELKEIGEKILNTSDSFFLIGGKEEPIRGLDNDRWREIGWTNDPHSLIAASDLFILPNKETYFDLILLEVLSLGVPVIMSNTGGNKYFSRYNNGGLEIYDTVEEAVEKIKLFEKLDIMDKKQRGDNNKKIFEQYFTVESFAKRYIMTLKDIFASE